MKDFKFLKLLDRFEKLFKKFKIDYQALRKILELKLTLDGRRVATALRTNKEEKKEDKNHFISSLWFYLFFGLIMIPISFLGNNYLFSMSIIFSMFIFLMSTSLIGDFSSVLLDLRDKEILLARPINSRTLNMAKFLHIFYYMSMITLVVMGPLLVSFMVRKQFLLALVLFLEIVLVDLFLIAFTGLLYLTVLRFFDGEKLKDIINYVQIGMTISLTIISQLVSRIFNLIDLSKIDIVGKWWTYILPPIWFAAPFQLIFKGDTSSNIKIYSVLALLIPLLSIVAYILLMPVFESNLSKLNSSGEGRKRRDRLTKLVGKIVCRTREERNFYIFTRNMLRNERTFKLKVYPNLGMGIIFPFLMILSFSVGRELSSIRDSKMFFNIYFSSMIVSNMLMYLAYSGNYKGAWIYAIMPIENRSAVYRGAVKAIFINLFTPLFIFLSLIFILIFGLRVLAHMLAAYLGMMLATCLIFRIINKDLPFSKAFETVETGKMLNMILSLLVVLVIFAIHFIINYFDYGVYIYILLGIITNIIGWKYCFNFN